MGIPTTREKIADTINNQYDELDKLLSKKYGMKKSESNKLTVDSFAVSK